MDYCTIHEISEKWNLSERRLQELCSQGRIPGAIKFGRDWAIPKDTCRPTDERVKSGKYMKSKLMD